MRLSEHFLLEELVASDIAVRKGIDNRPSPLIVENLRALAAGLEAVRALLQGRLLVSSGYRCPGLNQAVGGSSSSAHMSGFAADFTCREFGTPLEVARAIAASGIPFDQVIQEGRWVHFSVAPTMRREALTAHFSDGVATYGKGVG